MSADSSGKISLALGASRKPQRPAPANGVKRSHAALHDHEDDDAGHERAQTISHFDRSAGGAIDENRVVKDKGPLIIAPQANRDWKEASQRNKRQRSQKLGEVKGPETTQTENSSYGEESKPSYGLIITKSETRYCEAETNGHVQVDAEEQSPEHSTEPNGDASSKQKTADEEAMDALLGKSTEQGLILPAMTEEEAFDRDFRSAPDMSTLDDYARVPVEEFGAAMLRGMGWKDGEGIGVNRGKKVEKTKIPERRPALLGIGAKEEAAVAQELGTWGKAAKDRKGPLQIYNPVLLKDKKTGELFTEEELEKKKARDEREKYEMEFEREEKRKDKERRRRDRDDSKERDYDRSDRDNKRDRRDDRDRRKYDSDEEYYRRKEKEKRRRERERDGSDYHRERSRRYDSDRDRHRDHHRDRRR